ncbi:unnamed protein product [Arctia plantaginis]|uniref:UDP-glycosyltransferase n=1 Tax=Arctia plantaginis TaxID=874455 RepID=A0A8S0ZZG6_ARCPL|nr:unnamed protein product [Arctia plantaginis]
MPAKSHANLGDALVKQLLKDGNEVVYINCFKIENAPSSLRQIDVSANKNYLPENALSITTLLKKINVPDNRDVVNSLMFFLVAKTLENKEVQALLSDPKEHFDVVIVEWMFSDVFASFASLFGCPLIWVSSVEVNSHILSLIDVMPNPAYSTDTLSSSVTPFTFKERVKEVWTRVKEAYYDYMYYDKQQIDIYNEWVAPHFIARGRKPPSFEEFRYNASLVLGNSHISMGEGLRIPHNYKPVGGYHIDENVKPLPKDLKKIMDSAKDGVIYFSMGSNLKSKDWPVEIKQNLLNMFGTLKQTVLWKFEEDLPNVPKNVHILKWAPQQGILAHPNCVIFISHGGLLSTTEAINFGVPIIGIPVFGDQFVNVKRSVKKGFALKVDLTYDVAEALNLAIKEMLSKPTYKERAKELSYIYHDRPMKPAQELGHWVRHVVNTRGAAHLRSPAVVVPLYQRLFLDLVALAAIALFVITKLLCYLCSIVFPKKKMTALLYFLLGLTLTLNSCHAYKALVVYPMPARSHANLGDALVKQLLKDGNEVVYINCFKIENAPSSLRQIDVSSNKDLLPTKALSITTLLENADIRDNRDMVRRLMLHMVSKTLENKEVQKLLSDPKEHFDVVIVEWMFSEIFASLAPLFGCPLIWVSSVEINSHILGLIDVMPNPAYSVDMLSSSITPLSFQERVQELWGRLTEAYYDYMYYDKIQSDIYKEWIAPHFLAKSQKPPSFEEFRYNASLVLANSHISMGEGLRIPHNYKPVGGYHIDENVKPLPEDLKKIMDSAKDGVIYFSMGSNLKSKDWPVEIKQNLLNMFGTLKQTVLWKFEEDLPNVPKNVHILKWAPQQSILAHPNCVIFISHGGLLSTTEAINFGVPVIGIPVFGDQFVNVKRSINKGFALKVDLSYNVAKDLNIEIKEMLSKSTYRERVKELSYIYHDRPMKPAQELGHWVRHVVNTRGAAHLRSPAVVVPLYQRLFLDLVALVAISLLVITKLLCYLCSIVFPKKVSTVLYITQKSRHQPHRKIYQCLLNLSIRKHD